MCILQVHWQGWRSRTQIPHERISHTISACRCLDQSGHWGHVALQRLLPRRLPGSNPFHKLCSRSAPQSSDDIHLEGQVQCTVNRV